MNEHPSWHLGGERDSDKNDKRKESSSWGSLVPAGAKKQKMGPPCREYPQPSFTLRRVSGRSGRNAYENSRKLEVLKYSRLKCSDGNPVGRHGVGKVFNIDRKLVRDWERQEQELIAFSQKEGAGKQRSLHTGPAPCTAAAAVFWFSDCFSGLLMWRSINENGQMKYGFKASRRHEINSKLKQHHLCGGGGSSNFAEIDPRRGENHETRGNLFFFHLPRGENPVRMLPGGKGGGGGEGGNRFRGRKLRGIRYHDSP